MKNSSIWKNWIISEETQQGILRKDKNYIDRFYFDNFLHLKRFAYSYRKGNSVYEIEDILDSVYVDFYIIRFDTEANFYFDVKLSFFYSYFGGYTILKENKSKLLSIGTYPYTWAISYNHLVENKDGDTAEIENAIPSLQTTDTYFFDRVNVNHLPTYLELLLTDILSPALYNHFELRLLGLKLEAIINELDLERRTADAHYLRGRRKLVLNYKIILSVLSQYIDVRRYIGLIPDDYDKFVKQEQRINEKRDYKKEYRQKQQRKQGA